MATHKINCSVSMNSKMGDAMVNRDWLGMDAHLRGHDARDGCPHARA
jgi:hypothetical protein